MGLSRDRMHKKRPSGGRMVKIRCKRKYELARPTSSTKLGKAKIVPVRCRGGAIKRRSLKLDSASFSLRSQKFQTVTRITGVLYNAASNELVRTNTLTKGTVVQLDSSPFKAWAKRKGDAITLDPTMGEMMGNNKVYAKITARPGQVGSADGYVLEGKELTFYMKKILERKR